MNLRNSVCEPSLLALVGFAGALVAGACQLSTKNLGNESATGDGDGGATGDGDTGSSGGGSTA